MADLLARADGRRGAAMLRSVLAEYELPAITENELEERFLAACSAAGIPRPARQPMDRARRRGGQARFPLARAEAGGGDRRPGCARHRVHSSKTDAVTSGYCSRVIASCAARGGRSWTSLTTSRKRFRGCWRTGDSGEGGIRTLEAGITRPRDFQSRSLSQLGHLSGNASEESRDTRPRRRICPFAGGIDTGSSASVRANPAYSIISWSPLVLTSQ